MRTPEGRFADLSEYDSPHDRTTVRDDGAEMAYVDVDTADGNDNAVIVLRRETHPALIA